MPLTGDGYLAGEYPGGTTTVEGVPVSATVRILYRPESGQAGDGALVAQVQSAPDGTWRVEGLRTDLLYDVVGRKEGFNDVIVAGVTPTSMVDITYSGAVVENETFTGAEGYIEVVGGIPPYSVAAETPLPSGLFPVVSGRNLIIDGTTDADEVASFDVKVTSSNGAEKIIPLQLVVGFKAPQNLASEVIFDGGVFSVALTWEVTNSTQQVKVYRSATPFDLDDLPEPIATLSGTATTYTDDDVVEDDYFYYMVTAVCGQYELESEAVAVLVAAGDPHWDKVVALLHFDGDYTDETGKTWTAQNTIFTTGVFGQAAEFKRTSARSRVQSETNPDFALGTDDFTIEFLAKIDTSYNCALIDWRLGSSSANPLIESDGGNLYLWIQKSYRIGPFTGVINPAVFHHIALTREAGTARLFLDGVLLGSASYSESIASTQVTVGSNQNDSSPEYDLSGVVDELRITKGVARYTENFTPPTKPFPNK